ncbi:MAG: ACP S-malonyltransferase [Gammaproteobacteria bacterium]|nr:ACP S-malonyltransferase [Gammaproteobacteria bacterium]MBT8056835.1 ACP S-malonyltransferase [Gammaproteobacteria bacterium]
MNKTAFLFPGQGSQSIGMMSGFETNIVRGTFEEASNVLGYDLWTVVQEDPDDRLGSTEVTQPALLAAGIATWRAWKDEGGADPDYLAGHSLGEYSALVAAGSLAFDDAVSLVARRGQLMQQATPPGSGAMAAILGLDDEVLVEVCAKAAGDQVVSCANFNSPGQVVIAGDNDAVARAGEAALEAGARRAVTLAVSVPSHCLLMKPAADAMAEVLATLTVKEPSIPVLHNVDTATAVNADAIRQALVNQLWQPVRWSATVQRLVEMGVDRFAECGPGKVLSGLNRRICRSCTTVALTGTDILNDTLNDWS